MTGELITWSGISASVLIIAVLLIPRENTALIANRYLAGLIAVMSVSLLLRFMVLAELISAQSPILLLGVAANLFIGPCLLFYLLLLTDTQHPEGWNPRWHWLPGALGVVISLGLFWQYLAGGLNAGNISWHQLRYTLMAVQTPSTLSLLAYGFFGLKLLGQHHRRIKESFSTLDMINLNWLKWICWSLIVAALSLLIQPPSEVMRSFWQGFVYVGLLYYIGYMGIIQPAIFRQALFGAQAQRNEGQSLEGQSAGADVPAQLETVSNSLPGDSEQIWQSLQRLFEQEKPYQQPNINLARLAERLGIHSNRLSAVINHHGKCNFFDLINRQRIECAQILLLDQDCELSILDIAMESGFNSKSTFYSQFKKITEVSPSEYRKQYEI